MGLLEDARSIAKRDPAARSVAEVIFLYPAFKILVNHKIAGFFYRHKMFFMARWVSQRGRRRKGIEIHPAAVIGKGLFIDHGMGVVIGETAVIGDYCTIYHGVTLGGTGKETGKRHPTIGNNVLIGAGAKVLGPVTVGDNAMIGANTVVLADVPENSTIVGPQGRIVKKDNVKLAPSFELDQVHLPDPAFQDISRIFARLEKLEKSGRLGKTDDSEESEKSEDSDESEKNGEGQ